MTFLTMAFCVNLASPVMIQPCRSQPFQECQGCLDFVVVGDGPLRQHHAHLGRKGRQQLQGRTAVTAAATHRLAINSQGTQRW